MGQLTEPVEFTWDMSISRAEFERSLADAFGDVPYVATGTGYSHAEHGRAWRIELYALPDRAIGSLRLPRHRISFVLDGYSPDERASWIDHFRRYFQRGGG